MGQLKVKPLAVYEYPAQSGKSVRPHIPDAVIIKKSKEEKRMDA